MSIPERDKSPKAHQRKTWWNRPLWGKKSLVSMIKQKLKQASFKPEVPDTTIAIYKDYLDQARNIAAIANTIDDEKFCSHEFSLFLEINDQVNKNIGEYQGLKNSIDLLRVALETKESFIKIETIETRYRSYLQQQFYDYILGLLKLNLSPDKFREIVKKQLSKTIFRVKSGEGKLALKLYGQHLHRLSRNELGLKLLFLFKQYGLNDLSLFRKVAELADSFYNKNLDYLTDFTLVAQLNEQTLINLGQIIQVPKSRNTPSTYALILQYIALRSRYQNSYAQFEQIRQLLKDWRKIYVSIIAIQKQHPPSEYKQPSLFQQKIPGLTIYNKYQSFL